MYKRQVIVALEGVDGAGKTTLIDLLGAEFGNLAGVYSIIEFYAKESSIANSYLFAVKSEKLFVFFQK